MSSNLIGSKETVLPRTVLFVAAIFVVLLVNALFWFAYSNRLISLGVSLVIAALLVGGILLYKMRLSNCGDNSRIFLVALVCSGLLYMGVFTPFSAPDEVYHFEATYCLSNALMGMGYQDSPMIMRAGDAALIDNLSPMLEAANYGTVVRGLSEIFASNDVVEVNTGSTFDFGSNPPQVRVAAAVGITLARLLNLGPYYLIYIGRLFNLAFFICLVYLAYRIAPLGKNVFVGVALLPMTQHLAASYSYDAGILALSFLLIALALRAQYRKEPFSLGEGVEIGIVAALLAPCKVIYSLIVVLVLFIPSCRFRTRRQEIGIKVGLLLLAIFVVLVTRLAGIIAVSGASPESAGALDYRGEESGFFYTVGDVLSSPVKFIIMFLRTIDNLGSFYLLSMVGSSLGWFQAEIEMPTFLAIALIVLLLACMVCSDDDSTVLSGPVRVAGTLVFCVGSMGAMASMLFGWTFNTEQLIMGVQGRYFLPFLPLLLLGLRPHRITIKSDTNALLITAFSVINAINLVRIFSIALTL